MSSNRTIRGCAALAVIAALALAGCGDDGGDESGGAYGGKGGGATKEEPAASTGGGGEAAVVSVAAASGIGPILVGADGHTLYDFHKDQGTTSSCYGPCAKVWPPLLTAGEPQPRNGASASKLGTTKRKDGTVQVTYAGHPLYAYASDERPGEANGQDVDSFGAEWYALTASGAEAED